ncbi:MAG: hypothetical protein ACHBN1_23015 [Heteroscytonema crispum UTEX LB 1556]
MPTCSSVSDREPQTLWASNLTKSVYKVDQQEKFLHLQAEVDSLLEQLQNLKEQRLTATCTKEE